MNNMNKQQLFAFITEVSFALDDISLYLDTHPECPKALAAYSNYKAMRQQVTVTPGRSSMAVVSCNCMRSSSIKIR